MFTSYKDLKLDDLKIGMVVNTVQLHTIYDTYIVVANQQPAENGFCTGEIVFFGSKHTKEMKDIMDECTKKYGKRPMIYGQSNLDDGEYSL